MQCKSALVWVCWIPILYCVAFVCADHWCTICPFDWYSVRCIRCCLYYLYRCITLYTRYSTVVVLVVLLLLLLFFVVVFLHVIVLLLCLIFVVEIIIGTFLFFCCVVFGVWSGIPLSCHCFGFFWWWCFSFAYLFCVVNILIVI